MFTNSFVHLIMASFINTRNFLSSRYLAVTQPLNYSRRRRSKRLAMLMILVVWILALAITCPPIFLGW
jgi:accessory gene regulator protein AgrB